jgi:hypothetical protein
MALTELLFASLLRREEGNWLKLALNVRDLATTSMYITIKIVLALKYAQKQNALGSLMTWLSSFGRNLL